MNGRNGAVSGIEYWEQMTILEDIENVRKSPRGTMLYCPQKQQNRSGFDNSEPGILIRGQYIIAMSIAAILWLLVSLPGPLLAEEATQTAVFAGGCFWCMEPPYEKTAGIHGVRSGYTGGKKDTATYKEVSAGTTAHYEAIEVEYDPKIVSYDELLTIFWQNIDPFDAKGQFCDKGPQYRAAIFPATEEEQSAAKASLQETEKTLGNSIATEIVPFKEFFPAEEYHQDYYTKNPVRYKFYRYRCGRDARLNKVWGKH